MPVAAIDLDGAEPKVSNNPELKGREGRMWAVDAAYDKTGGDGKFWKKRSSIAEGLGIYKIDEDVDGSNFFGNSDKSGSNRFVNSNSQFQVTNENAFDSEQDLVNHLMGNFLWGTGPENYVFPENGRFSNALKGSIMVGESLAGNDCRLPGRCGHRSNSRKPGSG